MSPFTFKKGICVDSCSHSIVAQSGSIETTLYSCMILVIPYLVVLYETGLYFVRPTADVWPPTSFPRHMRGKMIPKAVCQRLSFFTHPRHVSVCDLRSYDETSQ